jgi:hypothetical protein
MRAVGGLWFAGELVRRRPLAWVGALALTAGSFGLWAVARAGSASAAGSLCDTTGVFSASSTTALWRQRYGSVGR